MTSLARATAVLMAGGALAQALPLLLGPLLTRLYLPKEFGLYQLFAAVAANVAVVACARYEFALPLARADGAARALLALCLRLLAVATLASSLASLAWAAAIGRWWPLWLGPAVAALGAMSIATLWSTRAEAFRRLAAARVVQHGGGALLQAALGALQWGYTGLLVAPIAAAAAAAALLKPPFKGVLEVSRERLGRVAREHREFPLLNTPHAFAGALQDTLAIALVAAWQGPAAAGFWGLALRYLKAPASLVGGAVSQALYPRLAAARTPQEGRDAVRQVMLALAAIAAVLVALLWAAGPWLFERAFGEGWRDAGLLARALALYVGLHFVASPLAVVTMAWNAQAWALRLAVVGQVVFVAALAAGLHWRGLEGAGWAVSFAMAGYFGWYFWRLATWPLGSLKAAAA